MPTRSTFNLDEALNMLERTPRTLRDMLGELSDGWIHSTYGADTFSPYDVVGHLITGERTDWMVRARIILHSGTAVPFERYDRYAHFEESRGKTMAALLDEFERLRQDNVRGVRLLNLCAGDLAKRGTHPRLGVVTLEQLLATWVVHDLNHIAQIARALAARYEQAVGPWHEYLGIYRAPATPMDEEGSRRRKASAENG